MTDAIDMNSTVAAEYSTVTQRATLNRAAARDGYAALRSQVREAGLFAPRPRAYALTAALIVVLLALGIGVLIAHPPAWVLVLDALLLAFVTVQIGLVGHDAAHRHVFAKPSRNNLLAIACMNLGLGGSAAWWRDKHNRHHSAPNHEDLDPDIDMVFLAFTPEQAAASSGAPRVIIRHQARLFFLLTTLTFPVLQFKSIAYLFRTRTELRGLEIASTIAHYVLVAGGLVLTVGPVFAIPIFIVMECAAGTYMACVFAPNHKGMEILDAASNPGYLEKQIPTSRNVKPGAVVDFLFGGLSCQIEHHLFPGMPRFNLRRSTPYVRAACAEHDISYHEASLLDCYRELLQHLRTVGSYAA